MYQPVQLGRLFEKIVEQIEQQILSGGLKAGDQLPPERELAEQFKVSRTAVREAIKNLAQKGLLEVNPGRGTFITNTTSQALRHSLSLVVKIGQSQGWEDLVEVRELLEPEIAILAAVRAQKEHIASMQEAITTMDSALDDANLFIEADLDFHLALAEATENAIIPILIDSIVDLLREQRKGIFQVEGGPERGQCHHKRILEAIIQGNPEAAHESMRIHLQQVRKDSEASISNSD